MSTKIVKFSILEHRLPTICQQTLSALNVVDGTVLGLTIPASIAVC